MTTLTNEQNYKLAGLEAAIKTLRDDLAAAGVLGGVFVNVQGGTLPSGSSLAGNKTVATFQIAKTEVTWGEWKTVRNWGVGHGYTDLANLGAGSGENFPVTNVSWYDVLKWCNAKSEKEGKTPVYSQNGQTYKTGTFVPTASTSANGYRLPSEKEWEWAARGGLSGKGYTYSGSNTASEVAWTSENSSDGTKSVGTKLANELGIYDMSGNVFEWCEDVFGVFDSDRRVRGGAGGFSAGYATVSVRNYYLNWGVRVPYVGFRPVCSSGN